MAANIKIKKIVKNSKMKRFQWKWIFTGSKPCCTILQPFRFSMATIWNPKWLPKYKHPPIWAKFGFQVDYDVANWYPNFTGVLSTMSRCADYFWNFQNGRHCHGNHTKTRKIWMKLSSFMPLVLVLFVWGTFVTLCVTVTNIW